MDWPATSPSTRVLRPPDLHLREMRRHRTLLVVDEVHHLPALAETDPVTAAQAAAADDGQASTWSRAILPLLSGPLERADGKGILPSG